MAALWDILGKAANLVQLLGLDSITVIAMIMSFLLFQQNKKQCQKLERRVQALRALLQRPTGGWTVIQHSEMGDLVSKAIEDADALVESYKKSTLLSHLRRGRRMASQFRDMRNVIESYCGLVPSINVFLLITQANPFRQILGFRWTMHQEACWLRLGLPLVQRHLVLILIFTASTLASRKEYAKKREQGQKKAKKKEN